MKKLNLFYVLAIALIALAGCKKENSRNELASRDIDEMAAQKNKEQLKETNGNGAVYVLDNAVNGNHVIVYNRSSNGKLSWSASYATEGKGTGSGLGSQGALVLDNSNHYLYAVNAGSNEISVFYVAEKKLILTDKKSSGGMTPISLTVHNNLLYVLNAGGSGNIQGYTINHGHLTSIAGSMQTLSSSSAGPAQIQFNNAGTELVVTEKATNIIDVFQVFHGVAGNRVSYPSVGNTPFGFAFTKNDLLVVSDAYGGMVGKSALTSYSLNKKAQLDLISGPVPTTQTAACWVVITNNGHFAYTSNAGSATISGFQINNHGELTLINGNGVTATTGTSPSDMALSNNSRFLYSRNGGANSISIFEVEHSGALSQIGDITGLPMGSAGLAAK